MTATEIHKPHGANTLPPITITRSDHDRLSRFIERAPADRLRVFDFLEQELERADLVSPHEVPRDVVTMNSRLLFRMNTTGLSRAVTLVYPGEADLMSGKVSILTPVGVALLGLRPGRPMPWEDRMGETKTLVVQQVLFQPEANKRFDL